MSHKCFNGLSSCVEHNKPPSVLDQAKAYTDSQRLAYTSNERAAISYDGNKEGKMIITSEDMGYTTNPDDGRSPIVEYSRFSDIPIYHHGIEGIAFGSELIKWFFYQDLTFITADGVTGVFPKDRHFGELPIIVIMDVNEPELRGTYSIHWNSGYVKHISGDIKPTIHTIDPKFLPGVCLPVVELSTIPTTMEGTALSAEESERMEEVLAMGTPFVVKGYVEEGCPISGICEFINPGVPQFYCHTFSIGIAKGNDNVWRINLIEE